jgi:hypothetical protein
MCDLCMRTISLADLSSNMRYRRNERNVATWSKFGLVLLACALVKWVNLGIYTESRDILRLRSVGDFTDREFARARFLRVNAH